MARPIPLLLAAVALCVLALASGYEPLLLLGLPGGLPLGTLLAALAFAAGAAVPFAVGRPGSALRWAGAAALVGAALWLPIGVALSGNAALSFVDDAADSALFWRLTAVLAGLVLVTMVGAGAAHALRRRVRRVPAGSA